MRIGKMLLIVLLLASSALAQSGLRGSAPAAGAGPAFDVSVGGSYLAMFASNGGTANLYGADAAGSVDFNRLFGATVDAGYVRTSDVFGLGHGSYVLTFLAGPVFYPIDRGGTRVSVRVLAGAGLVDSAIPTNGTADLQGWVARPSFVAGVGVQHSFIGPFAVRVDTDYLRTSFVDSTATVQPQNNLRMTVSLVFHLKDRRF